MPFADMYAEEGIFYAKAIGRIDQNDCDLWVQELRMFAQSSFSPVAAMVDAREVQFISPAARALIADATRIPRVRAIVFAAKAEWLTQVLHEIGKSGERGRTQVFPTPKEAASYAQACVTNAASGQQ